MSQLRIGIQRLFVIAASQSLLFSCSSRAEVSTQPKGVELSAQHLPNENQTPQNQGKETRVPPSRSDEIPPSRSDEIPPSRSDEIPASQSRTKENDALNALKKLYETEIKSIVDTRCQTCHASRKSSLSDFTELRKYAKKAYQNVKTGMMPPRPIPKEERLKLISFLEQLKNFSID